MLHAVIMAGGAGTRFWPASRVATPKQLLPLVGQRSMIQMTVDRLESLVPAERMLIVTSERLAAAIGSQLPELPRTAVLGEPCKRDTAPCIGLAAFWVLRNDPDAIMAVMPSDHVISPASVFRRSIEQAAELVERQPQHIITFGIRPTYAAESFGYIEHGEPLTGEADCADVNVFQVRRFREKPDAATAQAYLASGDFYWNAGIFIWKAQTILDALAEHQPTIFEHLKRIASAFGRDDFRAVLEREFAAIQSVSIDYAVMEHAKDIAVIEAPYEWDDVGSWQSLARLAGENADHNTIIGKHLGVNTSGTIVRGTADHLIVTLGLKDCIVVYTPDATLVANKHDEESIRRVVALLRERGWDEYL